MAPGEGPRWPCGITAAEVAYVIGNCRPQLNGMRDGIYYYTSAAVRTYGHYSSRVPPTYKTAAALLQAGIYADIIYMYINVGKH